MSKLLFQQAVITEKQASQEIKVLHVSRKQAERKKERDKA